MVAGRFELVARAGSVRCSVRRSFAALDVNPAGRAVLRNQFPLGLPSIFFPNEPSILVVRVAIITVALAVFALAVVFALIRPERGLQDHLAGTWLVPR